MSFKMDCPRCGKTLKVTEKAFGKTVPCPGCNQPLTVPQQPYSLPPLRPVEVQAPPVCVVQTQTNATLPLPPGMPPVPEISDESDPPKNPADLLARYRSTSNPRVVGIKEKLTRAVQAAKKRSLALKLAHEAKNVQMAIDTQLETLGTLTLTHRPSGVGISDEVAELSQVQDGLSQKQGMLDSLRQTKGSGAVVKELSKEVAQLQIRQASVMVAVGRKAWELRPDMPGAAGYYAALDRLQSSLEQKRRELRIIEDEIGPVWHTDGISLGAMKRPLLVVGAAAGGLLLLYLLWTLFGTGYRAEYRPVIKNGRPFLEVQVTGKAAKLAVMLTDPKGETETKIIEVNEMITNVKTVQLRMEPKPQPGTYTLLVKTFQPEQIVYRENPKFNRGKLTILDAKFKWKPWTGGGHQQPEEITLTVENQGTLPVCFDRLFATIGEQTCEAGCFVEGMNGRIETVRVPGAFFYRDRRVTEAEMRRGGALVLLGGFLPGTYPATLKLSVAGEGEEFLSFQKEVSITPPK